MRTGTTHTMAYKIRRGHGWREYRCHVANAGNEYMVEVSLMAPVNELMVLRGFSSRAGASMGDSCSLDLPTRWPAAFVVQQCERP